MSLLRMFAILLGGVFVMLAVTAVVLLDREQVVGLRHNLRGRLREMFPYLVVLGGVLVLNKIARDYGPELSWIIGWNITGEIYALEGAFVAQVQSIASPPLTTLFSFLYLYGYVFLLVFPFLAYVSLPDLEYLKQTTVAYGVNYAIGVACYVLFISYGPRNLIPDLVDPLLYATYPRAQIITSQVNSNTNVFPSLHASLATTVAAQAWYTRDIYPGWAFIAIPTAAGVVFSTMYLGIHWGTDVVAGILLGVGSLLAAIVIVKRRARHGV